MQFASTRCLPLAASLLTVTLSAASPLAAQEGDRPLFSEKVREVVDRAGADAAMGEVSMLLGTQRDQYVIDVDGVIQLGRDYLADGNTDAGYTVLMVATMADPGSADAVVALADAYAAQGEETMASVYYQRALTMDPDHEGARTGMEATAEALPVAPQARQRARAEPTEETEESEETRQMTPEEERWARMHQGPKRDDLDRFKGRYQDPDGRVYWVSETCTGTGYLMMGAEFGDVAPWIFRSESDLEFKESSAPSHREPVVLRFRAPADGQANGLVIGGSMDAELERIDDLPEGWEAEAGTERCYTQFM